MTGDPSLAFPPESQSEYAFPPGQGQDEADAADARNQQIQQSFDQSRMQRSFIQGLARGLSSEAADIARLRARQAAKT